MIYHLKCPRSYIYIGIWILTMICHLFRHIDDIWWISSRYTIYVSDIYIYIYIYIHISSTSQRCWRDVLPRGHPAGPVGRDLANRQRALGDPDGDPAWDGSQLGWESRDGFPTAFGIWDTTVFFQKGISVHISEHGVLMFLSFRVGNLCGPINTELSIDYGFS